VSRLVGHLHTAHAMRLAIGNPQLPAAAAAGVCCMELDVRVVCVTGHKVNDHPRSCCCA
jgi:hypothetical protein